MQKLLLKARWGEQEAENCWDFKYLGSIYEAEGGEMTDVKKRIVMVRTRFGQVRHMWGDNQLIWMGHILRMGSERKLKQTVFEMHV